MLLVIILVIKEASLVKASVLLAAFTVAILLHLGKFNLGVPVTTQARVSSDNSNAYSLITMLLILILIIKDTYPAQASVLLAALIVASLLCYGNFDLRGPVTSEAGVDSDDSPDLDVPHIRQEDSELPVQTIADNLNSNEGQPTTSNAGDQIETPSELLVSSATPSPGLENDDSTQEASNRASLQVVLYSPPRLPAISDAGYNQSDALSETAVSNATSSSAAENDGTVPGTSKNTSLYQVLFSTRPLFNVGPIITFSAGDFDEILSMLGLSELYLAPEVEIEELPREGSSGTSPAPDRFAAPQESSDSEHMTPNAVDQSDIPSEPAVPDLGHHPLPAVSEGIIEFEREEPPKGERFWTVPTGDEPEGGDQEEPLTGFNHFFTPSDWKPKGALPSILPAHGESMAARPDFRPFDVPERHREGIFMETRLPGLYICITAVDMWCLKDGDGRKQVLQWIGGNHQVWYCYEYMAGLARLDTGKYQVVCAPLHTITSKAPFKYERDPLFETTVSFLKEDIEKAKKLVEQNEREELERLDAEYWREQQELQDLLDEQEQRRGGTRTQTGVHDSSPPMQYEPDESEHEEDRRTSAGLSEAFSSDLEADIANLHEEIQELEADQDLHAQQAQQDGSFHFGSENGPRPSAEPSVAPQTPPS